MFPGRPSLAEWEQAQRLYPAGSAITAVVADSQEFGLFLTLPGTGVSGLAKIPELFPLHSSPPLQDEWPKLGSTVECTVLGHAGGRQQIDVHPTRYRTQFGAEIFSVALRGSDRTSLADRLREVFPLDPPLTAGQSWDAISDSISGGLIDENLACISIWLTGLAALDDPDSSAHTFLNVLDDVAADLWLAPPVGSGTAVKIVADWPSTETDELAQMPLHEAAFARDDNQNLQRLLNDGASANAVDRDGWTPLHHSAAHGYSANVRLLLEHGADASATTDHELTPDDLARRNSHVETSRALGHKR